MNPDKEMQKYGFCRPEKDDQLRRSIKFYLILRDEEIPAADTFFYHSSRRSDLFDTRVKDHYF